MKPVCELIKKAQAGDVDAFEELVVLYQDRVYTHCFYLSGNSFNAQDLMQEVFVRAFNSIKSFRGEADLGTWLHRIAVNLWINQRRRDKKLVAFSLDDPLETEDGELVREVAACQDSPLDRLERIETRELINLALDRIPPDFKVALVLREIEGYSYDEIAQIMDCSLGTVKSRISRGRNALRKELHTIIGRDYHEM
ncbi:RNA polymerase sigma factor [Syntrophomonas erecta]